MNLRPRTLFQQFFLTIALVSIMLQVFTISIMLYFVVVPLAQRSASDLAARIFQVAKGWNATPLDLRSDFSRELLKNEGLKISASDQQFAKLSVALPYFRFLKDELEKRAGDQVELTISRDDSDPGFFWTELRHEEKWVRVGFAKSNIGIRPPLALLFIVVGGIITTVMVAILLAQRITAPVERLIKGTLRVGKGQRPEMIAEEGPPEVRSLIQTFNRMSYDVQSLLDNRTILLSGISHDMRTPMTSMRIAVELLHTEVTKDLLTDLELDLENIDRLISDFLEIGAGFEGGKKQTVDIGECLTKLAGEARRNGSTIEISHVEHYPVQIYSRALQRVVQNLLQNAVRYGSGQPVRIEYACKGDLLTIAVLDCGPGIPPDQVEAVFRPFYRLETSQNQRIGGSGLGLAVVRALADSCGWTVRLLPREGGGTKAQLEVPLS